MSLIAFHNNPSIKDKLLADLTEHAKFDRIVHGQYWENGRGCAIGCTLHSMGVKSGNTGDHSLYETKLGIPRVIARMEDRIFEGLTNGKSKEWPLRFTRAIQPGADLSMVWPRLTLWMLSEELPKYVQKLRHAKQKAAIEEVAGLFREWCDGASLSSLRERLSGARAKVWEARTAYAYDAYAAYAAAAAAYAAYAAADAADAADDAYAADAAADAAYAAAADAADAAAYDAARSRAEEARSLAYERMADKLIELLESAPQAKQQAAS